MKILVINAGSSSLKYQLIDMDGEQLIAKGICERIGIDGKISGNTFDGREFKYSVELKNHTAAFLEVEKVLTSTYKVIDDLSEISAVGHRIVQGGSLFKESVLVDEDVIAGIESLCDLAPLHNAAHIQASVPAARSSAKMFRKLLFSTTLSIRPCPRGIPFPAAL